MSNDAKPNRVLSQKEVDEIIASIPRSGKVYTKAESVKIDREFTRTLNKMKKLLDEAIRDSGIDLDKPLPGPFTLTAKDLFSLDKDIESATHLMFHRWALSNNLTHAPGRSAVIQLDTDNSKVVVTDLVPHESLQIPEAVYLLDFKTGVWFLLNLDLGSRKYSEKLESFKFGHTLTFAYSALEYSLTNFRELTHAEVEDVRKVIDDHVFKRIEPKCWEIGSWIYNDYIQRPIEIPWSSSGVEVRERFLQKLLKEKVG